MSNISKHFIKMSTDIMILPLRNLYRGRNIIVWRVETPSPHARTVTSGCTHRLDRNYSRHTPKMSPDGCSAQTTAFTGYQDETATEEDISVVTLQTQHHWRCCAEELPCITKVWAAILSVTLMLSSQCTGFQHRLQYVEDCLSLGGCVLGYQDIWAAFCRIWAN